MVFGVYFPSCAAMREMYTKITEWGNKQFIMNIHTLFYFFHHITFLFMKIKMMIFTHHLCVSLTQLTFCWWHHSWLLVTSQWSDNCDGIMWKVISNMLDIDFIHGDSPAVIKKVIFIIMESRYLVFIFLQSTHKRCPLANRQVMIYHFLVQRSPVLWYQN